MSSESGFAIILGMSSFSTSLRVEIKTVLILGDDVENNDFPLVNNLLIMTNVVIFVCMLSSAVIEQTYNTWGVVPARFLAQHDAQQVLTMLSSMFLHGGWMHLIGNMWVLWLFGDNVEDRLGHFQYLLFYFACGMFADVVQILSDPSSAVPSVGASGAIAGVMAAYIALHPDARCKTWFGDDSLFFAFRTYKVPAVFIIFGWFALQIFSASFMNSNVEGIAFFAHIGGFLAGLALLCVFRYNEYKASDGKAGGNNVAVLGLTAVICSTMLLLHFLMPANLNKFPKPQAVQAQPAKPEAEQPQKVEPSLAIDQQKTKVTQVKHSHHHHATQAHHEHTVQSQHTGASQAEHQHAAHHDSTAQHKHAVKAENK